MKTVSWFSAGVSSAVATKCAIDIIDEIIYIHIDDQHPDTLRFVRDCEEWFGKPIQIRQSPYKNVEAACLALGRGYVNGPHGANCMRILKKRVRKEWEMIQKNRLCYIWGMDTGETDRAERIREYSPNQEHLFPLIEKEYTKEMVHGLLKHAGIRRPKMYEMGYYNNNCIGCVKGGMGYWNKIRKDFPKVFQSRAKLERCVGASCIKETYLDELDPKRGRDQKPICEECGLLCEMV